VNRARHPAVYTRPVNGRDRAILLGVLGVAVFLTGLELMITAIALPTIVTSLADWTQLRSASWIVNGYLLVYVATMPLAGRLADLWGARRLLLVGLAAFTVGSALAGASQDLGELIVARLFQALGGGIIVPVATAAAAHLYGPESRPRALGVIGGLTFLGMAAGPFAGAAILGSLHPATVLASLGASGGLWPALLDPAWRWVFYLNVPIGIAILLLAWAATTGWDTPRRATRVDLPGAIAFTAGLGLLLVGITLVGTGLAAWPVVLVGLGLAGLVVAVVLGATRADPFIDVRLFRDRVFASAALLSLLTGYAFATAIIGGAVFVDRVLYGGPGLQAEALGALAAATAVGALASGFVVRVVSLRLVSLAGLLLAIGSLVAMAGWSPTTDIALVALGLAGFGLGFGLTVTPRSTAAVERAGEAAFGVASATVTVARMIGMSIGLAVLTAYGSTVIDQLHDQIYNTPGGYLQHIPPDLQNRDLHDPLVVGALETWAAGEAARIMTGLFLVAAALLVIAIPAGLALESRARTRPARSEPTGRTPGAASDGRPLDQPGPS
jgi:MFS family permease